MVPAMFRKVVGLAFLTAVLAATVASGVFGSGASVADDVGLRNPMVLHARLMQPPRSRGGTESEGHVQRQSRPPSRVPDELMEEELAREADKLCQTPSTHTRSRSPIGVRKAALAKTQAKVVELEAAAKAAVEAVEEA